MTTHDAPPVAHAPAGVGIPVVAPEGDLDYENVEMLAHRLRAAARTSPAVILDAQEITFGDSSFLRVLIALDRTTDLRIARPRPAMQRLLELVGMAKVLRVFDSVEAAAAAPVGGANGD